MNDFEAAIAASRVAVEAMGRGDPAPTLALWSRAADAVLANPLGPPIVGFVAIEAETRRVAAMFVAVAEPPVFEEAMRFSTPELGYAIGVERVRVRRPGSEEAALLSLRVTTVFRREAGGWKLVLRHADRTPTN